MKILVCGDRNWIDKDSIQKQLSDWQKLFGDFTVIEGTCRGADTMAGEVAIELGLELKEFPADWDKHGKSAGAIRNRQMLDEEPDVVMAFHNDIANSKGTKDCIFEANKRGIEVVIIASDKRPNSIISDKLF